MGHGLDPVIIIHRLGERDAGTDTMEAGKDKSNEGTCLAIADIMSPWAQGADGNRQEKRRSTRLDSPTRKRHSDMHSLQHGREKRERTGKGPISVGLAKQIKLIRMAKRSVSQKFSLIRMTKKSWLLL